MKTITEYLQNDPVYYDFSDDCIQSAAYRAKKALSGRIISRFRFVRVTLGSARRYRMITLMIFSETHGR